MTTQDTLVVKREHLEQLALAATAWAGLLAMKQAMGMPLVPPGASVRIDGGAPQELKESDVNLPALMESVRAVRTQLGWRRP